MQFLVAEKTIRLKNLIKFSGINFQAKMVQQSKNVVYRKETNQIQVGKCLNS